MSERPIESRVGQFCDLCSQVDEHPRHHVSDGSGVQSLHFDCHAAAGCDLCAKTLEDAPKSARHGDALVAHLTKGL